MIKNKRDYVVRDGGFAAVEDRFVDRKLLRSSTNDFRASSMNKNSSRNDTSWWNFQSQKKRIIKP